MLRLLLNVLHPVRKPGGPYPLATLLAAIGFGLAFGFAGGWFGRGAYDAAYFRSHYQAPLAPPTVSHRVSYALPKGTPSCASVDTSRLPSIGDQGQIGACASWASVYLAASWEWRELHQTSWARFSPRQSYDSYSCRYNGGQDGGSWPDQDVGDIAMSPGLLQYKAWSYPPFNITCNYPPYDQWGHPFAQDEAKHQVPFAVHDVTGYSSGQGPGIIDAIKGIISGTATTDGKPHIALIAINVLPEFDAATQTGGYVYTPQPGGSSRGGHEIGGVSYCDTKRFPDGEVGGVLIRNSWTQQWGYQGQAWVSYGYLEQQGWGIEYETIGATAKNSNPPGATSIRGADGGHKLLPPPRSTGAKPKSGEWFVNGIYARDQGLNLTPYINAAGDRYGISPVGLAAILGGECGWSTGVNGDCDRWGYWPDVSFGACQATVSTAGGYGVGSGSPAYSNELYVRSWENYAPQCINLAAHILRDYANYENSVGCQGAANFPALAVAWNAGPYNPCWWLEQGGSGQAYLNHQNFLGWYSYAAEYAVGYNPKPPPPPKPPKFPLKAWRAHTHRVSPYDHGKHLRWEARAWWNGHVTRAGAIISPPQWFGPTKGRRIGYMTTRFQRERYYYWPSRRGWQKWIAVRFIR